jgi:hypothetical protein
MFVMCACLRIVVCFCFVLCIQCCQYLWIVLFICPSMFVNVYIICTYSRMIGNPNNLELFGSKKTKSPTQSHQNPQRSPIPEGENP